MGDSEDRNVGEGEPSIHEAERPWYRRVLESPQFRLMTLAPLALTAVANAADIASVASGLVQLWKPVLNFARHIVIESGLSILIPADIAIFVVVFFPFLIEGLTDYAREKRLRTRRSLIFGTGAYSVIFSWCVLLPMIGRSSAELVFTPFAIFWVMSLPYLLEGLSGEVEDDLQGAFVRGLATAVLISVFLGGAIFLEGVKITFEQWSVLALAGATGYIIPFLNARRLIQVCVVIVGVLVIAIAGDMVAGAIEHLKARYS